MKLKMLFGSEVITLPAEGIKKSISGATEQELKVLLALAAYPEYTNSYSSHISDIASVCGISEDDVERAVGFWRGAGAIAIAKESKSKKDVKTEESAEQKEEKTPLLKDDIPNYTGEEIGRIIDSNAGVKNLIDECQKLAGKMFNPLEISKVVALSDYLRLENEHILMLFGYCRSLGKTSVHYVEKTAFNLYNEGVDTLQKLEEYIKNKEEFSSMEARIRALFGLGTRSLTAREKNFVRSWIEELHMPYELVERAYEITVDNTDKLSLPYLNKILSNWHNAGIHTLEDAQLALDEYKSKKEASSTSSFDTDEFFELALKKSYESIEKNKNAKEGK